ncbi:MAG: pyridoxal-phosphate dependent enzyme [Natrialbaceae archaeon]|nr:pyridoxal-phosphate dependent enzyme [Natrialbaceae archaeon]
MLPDLTCPACETVYEAGPEEPWRCACGHALEFTEKPFPNGNPLPLGRIDTSHGLWTFFEFLPVERRVTFGEGFTPLIQVPEWDARFKLEYLFPTGSFKDRATTTISRAVSLGVEKVIEDSSGNAGAAIATYAARAGIDADIYVPADVPQSKLMSIQRTGARPVRIEGTREDVTAACIDAVESGEGWYASHAWNPAFFAGTMTFALEIAGQLDWSAPDAVVLPVGHGTLLLGAYRGFAALKEAGITNRVPRLYGVQAAGYAPVVEAMDGPVIADDDSPTVPDIIDSIRIEKPARGTQIVEAIEQTDGQMIALSSDHVETVLDRLHRSGFYVETTAAIAVAALEYFREQGAIGSEEDVVVPLTGTALKTL